MFKNLVNFSHVKTSGSQKANSLLLVKTVKQYHFQEIDHNPYINSVSICLFSQYFLKTQEKEFLHFFTFYIKRRISIIIFSFYFFFSRAGLIPFTMRLLRGDEVKWYFDSCWRKEKKNGATCSSNTKFKYCLFQCHGFVFSFIYVWVY